MEFRFLIHILIATFLITLVASCVKEVNIDIPGHEDMLVIDGSIETGRPPIVLISKSKNIYAPTNVNQILNGFLSGAVITVSNGTNSVVLSEISSENLPPQILNYILSFLGYENQINESVNFSVYTTLDESMFGETGKSYDLKVEFEGKIYTSTTQILEPKKLDKVFWKSELTTPNYGYSYAILSDNPNQYDAYCWSVRRINLDSNGIQKDLFFKKVGIPYFDDQYFNGKTFEFYFENPLNTKKDSIPPEYFYKYKLNDTVIVKFSTIPKDGYKFMEHKYTHQVTNGSPFSTPSNVPSNIKGGALGIWIGYSPSYDTLYCIP